MNPTIPNLKSPIVQLDFLKKVQKLLPDPPEAVLQRIAELEVETYYIAED